VLNLTLDDDVIIVTSSVTSTSHAQTLADQVTDDATKLCVGNEVQHEVEREIQLFFTHTNHQQR